MTKLQAFRAFTGLRRREGMFDINPGSVLYASVGTAQINAARYCVRWGTKYSREFSLYADSSATRAALARSESVTAVWDLLHNCEVPTERHVTIVWGGEP